MDNKFALSLMKIFNYCIVFLNSGLKTAYNLDVAMPLAQFADPWRKVHLKGEPEVIIYLNIHFLQQLLLVGKVVLIIL